MTFMPILMSQRGHGFEFGGLAVTGYLTAGAIGGFLGGWLSDRIGSKRVLVASLAGSIPFFYAFLFLPDAAALAVIFVGNLILQASLPVMVVMGQEIAPRHGSTMAGLVMGAAWGVGLLLMGPAGALADAYGIQVALAALAGTLVVGLVLALALPDTRTYVPPAAAAVRDEPERPVAQSEPSRAEEVGV
jgi:FSR family fosmidomycin resistance protein-like MFS transporter